MDIVLELAFCGKVVAITFETKSSTLQSFVPTKRCETTASQIALVQDVLIAVPALFHLDLW